MTDSALHDSKLLQNIATAERLAVFLDYDGTLTPIAGIPELATLSALMRATVEQLAATALVAVVSGRDLDDVRRLVNLPRLVYAGSHGFDICGPDGLRFRFAEAEQHLSSLDEAEAMFRESVPAIDGALIERKRYSVALHYRQVRPDRVAQVEEVFASAWKATKGLRKRTGKMVLELQPDVVWDKGRAVTWVLQALGVNDSTTLPIYIGDDDTDEDAFRELRETGAGIRVGAFGFPTQARYVLRDVDEVRIFLQSLIKRSPRASP